MTLKVDDDGMQYDPGTAHKRFGKRWSPGGPWKEQ